MTQSGWLVGVNKPKGITSFAVVAFWRKVTGVRKIGHAGTLDPMARGVLVLGIGRTATRQLQLIVKKEKEYRAEICLGATSSTDDAEGEIKLGQKIDEPSLEKIAQTLLKFKGKIKQLPPNYSAIKVAGRPAYRYAREGKGCRLTARQVRVDKIELIAYRWPKVRIRVVTGPGVYIRAIARDLGDKLGTGGYLTDLVRTAVGQFKIDKAVNLADAKIWWQKKSKEFGVEKSS